jgi:hypothetical protein
MADLSCPKCGHQMEFKKKHSERYNQYDGSTMIGNIYKCPKCQEEKAVVETKKGGCYVATCVYGSYDCPEVWTLRRYRDDVLSNSWLGRRFIIVYYATSPKLVALFGNMRWFHNVCKPCIDRLVSSLRTKCTDDSPYSKL